MKCPVCDHKLSLFKVQDFELHICSDGCSGMWFEKGELEKVDQHIEQFPAELLRVNKVPNVLIDRSKTRDCPCCAETELKRIVLDPAIRFEIDQCPKCEGHWLDVGELEYMRNEDRVMSEIQARMDAHEKKVGSAGAIKGLSKLLFS